MTTISLRGNAARTLILLLVLLVLLAPVATGAMTARATTQSWAPFAESTIHPGIQTFTAGGQCTANFVFVSGDDVLLGQAAHCGSEGDSSATNGCETDSAPLGTAVEITGATQLGTLVYSSWLTMHERNETDAATCDYNDFALVRIHPDDHDKVNPSMPGWGGPLHLSEAASVGETVYTYGRSSLRPGFSQKEGSIQDVHPSGWRYTTFTANPGIPGDSGSGYIDERGGALGVLATISIGLGGATNGVTSLDRALAYANAHASVGATMAIGTEVFTPTGEAPEPPEECTTEVVRHAGSDRYATAVEVSKERASANVVVIATGRDPADALSAGPAAAGLDASLLLAGAGGLSDEVIAEVERLGATTAWVIGGVAAVPAVVEQQLADAGVANIDRITGTDRYETAAKVASTLLVPSGAVLVASGLGFADALAAAPLAAARSAPLLLTHPDRLPDATRAALVALDPARITVVGGNNAVPDGRLADMAAATGTQPERIAGRDRYSTAAEVAGVLSAEPGFTFSGTAWIASGLSFPDALAAGPAVARTSGMLWLTTPTSPVPSSTVSAVGAAQPATLAILGGTGAIGDDAVAELCRVASDG